MKTQFAFSPSDYVEVHHQSDNVVTHGRTVAAIPLHPTTGNPNEWLFYSLESGDTFVRNYDEAYLMTMSKSIVDRLNTLAARDPISGDPEINLQPTDVAYVPTFYQPPLPVRGRPRAERIIETTIGSTIEEDSK